MYTRTQCTHTNARVNAKHRHTNTIRCAMYDVYMYCVRVRVYEKRSKTFNVIVVSLYILLKYFLLTWRRSHQTLRCLLHDKRGRKIEKKEIKSWVWSVQQMKSKKRKSLNEIVSALSNLIDLVCFDESEKRQDVFWKCINIAINFNESKCCAAWNARVSVVCIGEFMHECTSTCTNTYTRAHTYTEQEQYVRCSQSKYSR